MVTFQIVRNTLSLHIFTTSLTFIRHKQGFFKSSPLSKQYGEYQNSYERIKLLDFRIGTARYHSHIIIVIYIRSQEMEFIHVLPFITGKYTFINANLKFINAKIHSFYSSTFTIVGTQPFASKGIL